MIDLLSKRGLAKECMASDFVFGFSHNASRLSVLGFVSFLFISFLVTRNGGFLFYRPKHPLDGERFGGRGVDFTGFQMGSSFGGWEKRE